MMTRSQYSQALAVLERLANANESQAELLRAVKRQPPGPMHFATVEATSDFTRTTP